MQSISDKHPDLITGGLYDVQIKLAETLRLLPPDSEVAEGIKQAIDMVSIEIAGFDSMHKFLNNYDLKPKKGIKPITLKMLFPSLSKPKPDPKRRGRKGCLPPFAYEYLALRVDQFKEKIPSLSDKAALIMAMHREGLTARCESLMAPSERDLLVNCQKAISRERKNKQYQEHRNLISPL